MVYLVFFSNYFRYLVFVYILYRLNPDPVGSYREGLAYDYCAREGKPGLLLYLLQGLSSFQRCYYKDYLIRLFLRKRCYNLFRCAIRWISKGFR